MATSDRYSCSFVIGCGAEKCNILTISNSMFSTFWLLLYSTIAERRYKRHGERERLYWQQTFIVLCCILYGKRLRRAGWYHVLYMYWWIRRSYSNIQCLFPGNNKPCTYTVQSSPAQIDEFNIFCCCYFTSPSYFATCYWSFLLCTECAYLFCVRLSNHIKCLQNGFSLSFFHRIKALGTVNGVCYFDCIRTKKRNEEKIQL